MRRKIVWLAMAILAMLASAPERHAGAEASSRVWGTRPLISYFGLTGSLITPLRREAQLTPGQMVQVRRTAQEEAGNLRRLLDESEILVSGPQRSLEEKRLAIRRMGFNARVDQLVYSSDRRLRLRLGPDAYARLVNAVERMWWIEVARRSRPVSTGWTVLGGRACAPRGGLCLSFGLVGGAALAPAAAVRSYEIFATRYDAGKRYTAALPDQCLKLTNGGLTTCKDKGYAVGQTYSVIMRFKKSVGVDVGEAGPWNIDDNFWATRADPTPRRMFADLALGMPEAQAAYFNGYNGGQDQYGRKVTAPFAIDLAFQVADDLGMAAKSNEWITVSFMWTESWGAGGSGSGNGNGGSGSESGAAVGAAVIPLETAAANPDGSIIHEVRAGQTLWAIAVGYGVTIHELRGLNALSEEAVIVPGQKLVVRPAGAAVEPTLVVETPAGVEIQPVSTPTPTAADVRAVAQAELRPFQAGPAQPPDTQAGEAVDRGIDPLLGLILAAAGLGLVLIIIGRRLAGRQDD